MRLFITVNMSRRAKEKITEVLPTLKAKIRGGKWVIPDNLHITMLFLGEVGEGSLAEVERVMTEAVQGFTPFQLRLEGLGVFPNASRPKILWAGVNGEQDKLNQLYQNLLHQIKKTKLPFDAKPAYTPHVTLARKIGDGFEEGMMDLKTEEWQVDSLELYQSTLKKTGVIYHKIKEIPFD